MSFSEVIKFAQDLRQHERQLCCILAEFSTTARNSVRLWTSMGFPRKPSDPEHYLFY